MNFGKRLKETRMQKKMTQQALADKAKVELRTYQRYEQGVREPSFATLLALADALEVSTDYLLGHNENT
ncbi:MAG: helix-turn-helix transcriptional regulator [Clostridia bacterium]|nr:helix-turn-helix transcriptional regulator [Clostridia bacterium]